MEPFVLKFQWLDHRNSGSGNHCPIGVADHHIASTSGQSGVFDHCTASFDGRSDVFDHCTFDTSGQNSNFDYQTFGICCRNGVFNDQIPGTCSRSGGSSDLIDLVNLNPMVIIFFFFNLYPPVLILKFKSNSHIFFKIYTHQS